MVRVKLEEILAAAEYGRKVIAAAAACLVILGAGHADAAAGEPPLTQVGQENHGNMKGNEQARLFLDQGIEAYRAEDYAKALPFFRLADVLGHMKAARYLGLCYEHGYGVEQDSSAAAHWYQKAADAGDITGTCYLGHMYEEGLGVPQDYAKAMDLYLASSQRGDVIAAPGMVAAGRLYEYGRGVTADKAEARKWYEKALAAGYEAAAEDLARLEHVDIGGAA